MSKRIEIIIKGEEAYNPETLREIAKGNFSIDIVFPPPIPIYARQDPLTGRVDFVGKGFIIEHRPSPEPPTIYLTIEEGEGREDRIRELARDLVKDYKNIETIGDYPKILHIIGEIARTLEEEEGEGSQIRDITGQTKEDLESQIWEIHQALTKAGEYPNKYETFSEAIEALSQRGEGRDDRLREKVKALLSVVTDRDPSDMPRPLFEALRDLSQFIRGGETKSPPDLEK